MPPSQKWLESAAVVCNAITNMEFCQEAYVGDLALYKYTLNNNNNNNIIIISTFISFSFINGLLSLRLACYQRGQFAESIFIWFAQFRDTAIDYG